MTCGLCHGTGWRAYETDQGPDAKPCQCWSRGFCPVCGGRPSSDEGCELCGWHAEVGVLDAVRVLRFGGTGCFCPLGLIASEVLRILRDLQDAIDFVGAMGARYEAVDVVYRFAFSQIRKVLSRHGMTTRDFLNALEDRTTERWVRVDSPFTLLLIEEI